MRKVIILQGLPASGKSTWAKELVKKDKSYKRINKDDLRAMIDNSKWSKENERNIIAVRDTLIMQTLEAGYNVIVDDTNFGKHVQDIKNHLFRMDNVMIELQVFDTPVWTCIERDAKRDNPVGKKVIWDMHARYLRDNKPKGEFISKKGIPNSIICDIDGTLAHMDKRSPFQYDKVGTDICDVVVVDIIQKYFKSGFNIILCSGREDVCKEETVQWLEDNLISYDELYMRKAGDNRPDYDVKKEIYEKYIKNYNRIFMCLDDRDQVVNLWRELGLKCLQCEYGNF